MFMLFAAQRLTETNREAGPKLPPLATTLVTIHSFTETGKRRKNNISQTSPRKT